MDHFLKEALDLERDRQENNIELIASENYVSNAVLELQGSILTNKYAEGYPGKRYYGGCQYIDIFEEKAIQYAKELFHVKYVNVQPHSGSQANMAVYRALLNPKDKVLGMNLSNGGHLTHGYSLNFSGKDYEVISYNVKKDTEMIDYNEIRDIALREKPKMIIAGASAYSRIIDFEKFRSIADEVGAILFVDMAHIAGLVAAGFHENPVQYADVVTSTTHKTLRGPRGGFILTNDDEIAKKIDTAVFPRTQGGPLMHVIAGKAICFGEALKPEFKDYVKRLLDNCFAMMFVFAERGFKMVAGGTDTHMIVLDLRTNPAYRVLTGKRAEDLLSFCGIVTNKNTIPGDTRPKSETSGLRLGTPAITTRGFTVEDCKKLANIICDILVLGDDITLEQRDLIRDWVSYMCKKYPLTSIN